MSEEEKKAIERLYSRATDVLFNVLYSQKQCDEDIKIVLNLIQNQQTEIEKLKKKNKELLRKLRNRVKEVKKLEKYSLYKKEFSKLNEQIKKKDKIIDKMAEFIDTRIDNYLLNLLNIDEPYEHYTGENKITCKECIKQHFERKAEQC